MRGRAQQKVVHFENLIPFSPTQEDPDYNPRDDGPRRPARPNRNRRPVPSLSESPVTSEEESSPGTCSGSVSGSDRHSDADDGPTAWTHPKAPVQPRRQPANRGVESGDDGGSDEFRTCPDDSDAGDQERPSTSQAADDRRPRRQRRRPARLEDFISFDSDEEYIDLT
ncbi:PREDICTED: uncharacterized protein LOC109481388 [Branchiostoma belcheri]|uniref:Uncharacterized protein LOC109481388 n=1 Tax=Branchiostoma belcheri TaxID=7741 RepID=A0A6P4ZZP1_BRABE|nr:PREDICTED: uncharacterized protein LOC109481388 [Branchiostoma belcheri]